MMRTELAALAVIIAGTIGIAAESGATDATPHKPAFLTTPCAQEDSSDCYWNAHTAGNGRGRSFYAVTVNGRTCVLYWSDRFAKRHNYCTPAEK